MADLTVNLDELDNVSVFEGAVEDVLPLMPEGVEVMVANPPAAGLSRKAVTAVTKAQPTQFIYVSSDVATLARDGRSLAKAGYRLVEVQPIDGRPQTFHIETVSLWTRA